MCHRRKITAKTTYINFKQLVLDEKMKTITATILFIIFSNSIVAQAPLDYPKIKKTILLADTIHFDLNDDDCFTSKREKITITTKDFKSYYVNYYNKDSVTLTSIVSKSRVSGFIDILILEINRKRDCEFVFTTVINISGYGQNLNYRDGCQDDKRPIANRLKRKLKILY
jgi:hypothetical protein